MINLSNWSLENVIKIFYSYGDSKSLKLEIPIDEVIIPPDVTNLIHKNIQNSKVNFELNEKVNYKNILNFKKIKIISPNAKDIIPFSLFNIKNKNFLHAIEVIPNYLNNIF